jgi:hypothetical protein
MSFTFIHGVSDESAAFDCIGPVFCDFIEEMSFAYCITRKSDKKLGHYNNTIKLYHLWENKIKGYDLKSKISSLEEEMKKITTEDILPVGASKK